MSRSRVKKKNSSFRGSVVTLIIILIVVGIVNGCNLIRNHIVSNSNFNNKFNEEDFNRKLIPRDTLIDALKIEYPRIDLVKSTDYGYSNPSNIEEYEIVTGINENGSTVSTGIQIWTYSKEDNYLFSNDKNVEFKEIDGKLEQINIIADSKDFPIDGDFMKNLLVTVSKGIGKELTLKEVSKHVDIFLTKTQPFRDSVKNKNGYADLAKGSSFKNDGVEYFLTISVPDKRFSVDGVYIYGIHIDILDQDTAEKAFKVLYEIKD